MSSDEENNLLNAVLILQSGNERLETRINALRHLKSYVENNEFIDAYNRKRINQLIIDNVMKVIIESSNEIDNFKRQLIRVEIFVLLSQILRSSSLFGAELTESVMYQLNNLRPGTIQNGSLMSNSDFEPRSVSAESGIPRADSQDDFESERMKKFQSRQAMREKLASQSLSKSVILFPSKKKAKTFHDPVEALKNLKRESDFSLIKNTIHEKRPKMELYSKLKPRPSVLFDDKLHADSFVPGTDPLNFYEQDRKLGYQKPRMWFPIPQLDNAPSLLQPKKNDTNQVVEEYLKMKSMASYVGDLIVPPGSVSHSKRAIVDSKRYSNALTEAMMMWTPILNTHKHPNGSKKRKISYIASTEQDDADPAVDNLLGSPPPRSFYEDSIKFENSINTSLSSSIYENQSINEYNQFVKEYSTLLSKQTNDIQSDLSTIHSKINQIIAKNYSKFHNNYRLLLEGKENKSRYLLQKLTKFYLRNKRKNMISLAFGMWKILVIDQKSEERRPQYARIASCHLLVNWYNKMLMKNFKIWFYRWRYVVMWIIYHQRYREIIKLQTFYRRLRDTKKMIERHIIKPYLGLYSDIELAPPRDKKLAPFQIPIAVRKEKRMYWLAAIKVQSMYRCWIKCREYFKRKRQLILLQSIFRMWPKLKYYRRLKAATIKSQAWSRRTVKRRKYLRLLKDLIVIQKYVRRYLYTLHVLRLFNMRNQYLERRMYAAIKIQCRVRIRRAKKVVRRKKYWIKKREYSALVIQRNWYRFKKAFHTFFLMCCLREREVLDLGLENKAVKMNRYYNSRKIKRYYQMRYFKRNIESVIKVQCWFRGRLGYNLVSVLRKQRWASRKLRHWMRCRLRKRNIMARRIQRWWWKSMKLRLLKHLWYLAKKKDLNQQKRLKDERYTAACTIQAFIKGIWDRRWVKRHKAALLIQRNAKFFFGIKRWKSMKRDQNLKYVKKIVSKMIEKGIQNQTERILTYHNQLITRAQALIRRFLIRIVMIRSKEYARKVGKAVVLIQRSWRRSGEISKAVEELLQRKRLDANPFKHCYDLHPLLLILRQEIKPYYNYGDLRVGMKIPIFLYRLGLLELIDLFPKRHYVYVTDLMKLTMEKLTDLYNINQNRSKGSKKKATAASVLPSALSGAGGGKKTKGPPTQLFQNLLEILKIPLFSRKPEQVQKLIQALSPITDYLSPNSAFQTIRKLYLKRFGKHLQTRASNVTKELIEFCYANYQNYKLINGLFPTIASLQYILNVTPDSTQVISTWQDVKKFYYENYFNEDKKWELERYKHSAHFYQLAIDRCLVMLPKTSNIRLQIENLITKVISYKRKAAYSLKKIQDANELANNSKKLSSTTTSNKQAGQSSKTNNSTSTKKDTKKPLGRPSSPTTDPVSPQTPPKIDRGRAPSPPTTTTAAAATTTTTTTNGEGAKQSKLTPPPSAANGETAAPSAASSKNNTSSNAKTEEAGGSDVLLTDMIPSDRIFMKFLPEDCLENIFDGETEFDYELDYHLTLTRAYGAFLHKYYLLSMAINSIKNAWNNKAMKRAMMNEKRKLFLHQVTNKYKEEQTTNFVKITWEKMRKREIIQKKTDNIIAAIRERKAWIEDQLQYVLRYHVAYYQDDWGYYYYVDEKGHSSYEIPLYSYYQWIAVEKIQKIARKYIIVARERRLQREAQERLEIELAEKRLIEERKQAMKAVTVKLFLKQFSKFAIERAVLGPRPTAGNLVSNKRKEGKSSSSQHQKSPSSDNPGASNNEENSIYRDLLTSIDMTKLDEELDQLIPYPYRFNYHVPLSTGTWALLYTQGNKEPVLGQRLGTYQVVIVFKIRFSEGLCDVRTVKGNIMNNISLKRLRHLNYSPGMKVECRYRYKKLFYRGIIVNIHDKRDQPGFKNTKISYSVRYEDNEIESFLERDAIRPMSGEELNKFFKKREEYLMKARIIYRRKLFYQMLKKSRRKETVLLYAHRFLHPELYNGNTNQLLPTTGGISDGDDGATTMMMVPTDSPSMFKTPRKRANTNETIESDRGAGAGGGNRSRTNTLGGAGDLDKTTTAATNNSASAPLSTSLVISTIQNNHSRIFIPSIKVKIKYTRQIPRYPWQIIQAPSSPEEYHTIPYVFFNPQTEEETEDHQDTMYNARELHVIKRIQMKWLVFRAMKLMKKKTMSINVKELIENTIQKGKKIGWIGYKFEGLTPLQYLIRAGYSELAEIIHEHYTKTLNKSVQLLSLEDILNAITRELYEKQLGVLQQQHVRDLKEFQTWWKKTSLSERDNKLTLFNYYSSCNDPRTLKKCIEDSLELMIKKFSKFLKTSATKTRKVCSMLIEVADFPHAHLQIETYLKRYSDKPELAREYYLELVNKHTTHTYIEEGKVLKLYYHTSLQLSRIFAVYKMKNIRNHILNALKKVENMMKEIAKLNNNANQSKPLEGDTPNKANPTSGTATPAATKTASPQQTPDLLASAATAAVVAVSNGGGGGEDNESIGGEDNASQSSSTIERKQNKVNNNTRPLISGLEAKAAWIIREEIFQYLLNVIIATTKIQCRWKAYSYRNKWKLFLSSRLLAIDKIQRCFRRYQGTKISKYLKQQRESPWEQLWNSQYNLLYYYNRWTGKSQYQEPEGEPYRPLIRDKRSAQLIQAWPDLDELLKQQALSESNSLHSTAGGNHQLLLAQQKKFQLPTMSKTMAKSMGLLNEIPNNLLCIICETRKVVRYCLECNFELIAIKNHNSRANSPNRTRRPGSTTNSSLDHRSSSSPNRGGTASRGGRRVSFMDTEGSSSPNRQQHHHRAQTPTKFQRPVPYCLPCYLKEHSEDKEDKYHHRYQLAIATIPPIENNTTAIVPLAAAPSSPSHPANSQQQQLMIEDLSSLEGSSIEEGEAGMQMIVHQSIPSATTAPSSQQQQQDALLYLKCCMCDRPATKKCQGLVHEEDIDNLVSQLKKANKFDWQQVIAKFTNIASEQKLMLLIEEIIENKQIHSEDNNEGGGHGNIGSNESVSSVGNNSRGENGSSSIHSDPYYNSLSPNQLQQIRYQLEKMQTECDECYCSDCYKIVHSGGKRCLHHWKGFQEYAIVCFVCQSKPSEFCCIDCLTSAQNQPPNEMMMMHHDLDEENNPNNNDHNQVTNRLPGFLHQHAKQLKYQHSQGIYYCSTCFNVYHTIGRKKRHKKEIVYETNYNNPIYLTDAIDPTTGEVLIPPEDQFCSICIRRLGHKCPNEECVTIICDECYEYKHAKRCRFKPPSNEYIDPNSIKQRALLKKSMSMSGRSNDNAIGLSSKKLTSSKSTNKFLASLQPDEVEEEEPVEFFCVVCNEPADKKCLQCGDYYCSRTWMGNPGCFIQFHSKGNRATHQTAKLSELNEVNRKPLVSFTTLLEKSKVGKK